MKQRFSSLDVKVLVAELRTALLTLRLSNIYDLSSRIFLLKFAKPSHREQLLVDSGFRCHLTQFARATAAAPSAFVARLRKFLKTRRVTEIRQVGTDRVIEFVFSDGIYRLFLEFYAGGNVILTDAELNILSCLRIVSVQEGEEVRIGGKYLLEHRQNVDGVADITEERVRAGLEAALSRAVKEEASVRKGKKRKIKAGDALRKALATSLNELPPPLLEHAFLAKEFDATIAIENVLESEIFMAALLDVLLFAREVAEEVASGEVARGYIVAKAPRPNDKALDSDDGDKENLNLIYEDFQPFRPKQYEKDSSVHILEFEGYNATVDEFFSSIESQKLESRLHEREEHARKKLEAARQDHDRRLGGLQQVQELNVRKAQAIEANLQRVQETTMAVNGLIAQGMDWVEIARLIEMEQARNNLVAEIIKLPLKLYENTITVRLHEAEIELDDDDDADTDSDMESDMENSDNDKRPDEAEVKTEALDVDIDLALSPWSNARQYYDQKRTAATKEQKTLQSSGRALKSTEKKITADLKKGLKEEKEILRPIRKQFWFEKFFYFVSSEGHLVLAGKDMQQSEILYKRYLSKGDVYIHAELNGAASVIVKNKAGSPGLPIPPYTLSQAGNFCVATSSAWESKAVMAAWWVNADQVHKTAPNGEHLAPGLFIIKGKKNFLPPAQLLLGFGVMFRISEESKTRHVKNRVADDSQASSHFQILDDPDFTDSETTKQNFVNDHFDERTSETEEPFDVESVSNTRQVDEASDHDSAVVDEEKYLNPLQSRRQVGSANHSDVDVIDSVNEVQDTPTNSATAATGHDSDSCNAVECDKGDDHTASDDIDSTSPALLNDSLDDLSISSNTKATPQIRGKHGKKVKIKTKYAHQDEADRALALRLLGSKVGQGKIQAETEKKVNREQEAQVAKERRKQQHIQTQAAGKESEEKRNQQMDQGLEVMDPEEIAELNLLDLFVGSPLPGDEILDALIVCAPWDALGSKLKWRVKLQPGAQKKGKIVREVLEYWNRQINEREKKRVPKIDDEDGYAEEKTTRREGELIKCLRDVEIVGVVPVMKLRAMIFAASNSSEKGKGRPGTKGGGRGGKGSKKVR